MVHLVFDVLEFAGALLSGFFQFSGLRLGLAVARSARSTLWCPLEASVALAHLGPLC